MEGRRINRFILLISLITIFYVVSCNNSATIQSAATSGQAVIISLQGDVAITRQNSTFPGYEGMILYENDLIHTAEEAFCQVRFFNDAVVSSSANSTINFNKMNKNEIITRIISGTAVFKVEKIKEEEFIVQSANKQFRVRGTEFLVKNQKDLLNLAVLDGNVEVFSDDQIELITNIEAGNEAIFYKANNEFIKNDLSPAAESVINNFNATTEPSISVDETKNVEVLNYQNLLKEREDQLDLLRNELNSSQTRIEQLQAELSRLTANLNTSQENEAQKGQEIVALTEEVTAVKQLLETERTLGGRYRTLLEEQGIALPEED